MLDIGNQVKFGDVTLLLLGLAVESRYYFENNSCVGALKGHNRMSNLTVGCHKVSRLYVVVLEKHQANIHSVKSRI